MRYIIFWKPYLAAIIWFHSDDDGSVRVKQNMETKSSDHCVERSHLLHVDQIVVEWTGHGIVSAVDVSYITVHGKCHLENIKENMKKCQHL